MYNKNDVIKMGESIYRVLVTKVATDTRLPEYFCIDCRKKTMPKWFSASDLELSSLCSEEEFQIVLGDSMVFLEDLGAEEKKTAHERYSVISAVLPFVGDKMQSQAINKVAEENNLSRKTVTNYLCQYLVYQNMTTLAPKKAPEKSLTKDQKNIRWALNKFYYTKNKNSLTEAYTMMLKAKYTDDSGSLLPEYPSLHQFKYYYRQNKSLQKEYIRRGGIKDYEMNHRPLLGDGVRQFAPAVGVGMLDATICDIYLCDDSGNLVGRPILVACVDAYSGMCCGYSLLWEGGMYSLRDLMLNCITDKEEWCRQFGIAIDKSDWDCAELPGVLVTDMGTEYKSFNFEQMADLGCRIVNLPSFRPELKGSVEKFFDLIQDTYKPYLKNKGVIDILLVGTNECLDFFTQSDNAFQMARRSVGLRYGALEFGTEFRNLCKVLFSYQYVKNEAVLTEGLMTWLYEHSAGNPSTLVTLIHDAQEIAILDGREVLGLETLTKAYNNRLQMLHGFINPGLTKKPQTGSKREIPETPVEFLTEKISAESSDSIIEEAEAVREEATFVSGDPETSKQFGEADTSEVINKEYVSILDKLITFPTNKNPRYMCYCPICAKEDRETYGETYWHRVHVIRDLEICPKHRCKLVSTDVEITASQSPRLFVAENVIPYEDDDNYSEPEFVEDTVRTDFAKYRYEVFNSPMQMENNVQIGKFLESKLEGTKYLPVTGRQKYISLLFDEIIEFYKDMPECGIVKPYQIQRIFTGYYTDFYSVCQVGYFLNVPVSELINPRLPEVSQTELFKQEVARLREQGLGCYRIAKIVGSSPTTALKINRVTEKADHDYSGRKGIRWAEWEVMDKEMLPLVEKKAFEMYTGNGGRPRRVTKHRVESEMGFPDRRLEYLPMCKEAVLKYAEDFEHYWARECIWAYEKLKAETESVGLSKLMKITNLRKKNVEACVPHLEFYTDSETAEAIRALVK